MDAACRRGHEAARHTGVGVVDRHHVVDGGPGPGGSVPTESSAVRVHADTGLILIRRRPTRH